VRAHGRADYKVIRDLLENPTPEVEHAISVFIEALRDQDSFIRCAAAWALGNIGPAAKDAVPALSARLGDMAVRAGAAWALRKIGPDAVPALVAALRHEDCDARWLALDTLQEIGWVTKDAVPEFIDILRHRPPGNAGWDYVTVLGQIGPDAIPALIAALRDEDVREWASEALAAIGSATVPALSAALRDEDWNVRYWAADALGKIGGAAKDAVPALSAAMRDEDKRVRYWAYSALQHVDGGAAARVQKILKEEADAAHAARLETQLKEVRAIHADLLELAERRASEMEGIEVVEDQALRIKDELDSFRRIGDICMERKDDRFSFREMERLLGIVDSTIQDHMSLVSEFFREYFKKFENVHLAEDDEKVNEDRKLVDRPGSGKKPRICRPWGWKAWELTCLFLKRREEIEAARRRANRPDA
jgi:HEAT repeat protein